MDLRNLSRNKASAVRARERMLREGVTMKGDQLWTAEELGIVANYYPDYEAIERILPHRTRIAMYYAARKVGVRKSLRAWSASDVSKLRKFWHRSTQEELLAMFPGTTWEGLRSFAGARGFRRPRRPYKLTGCRIFDQIRARCFEIGWTMIDLDKEARTGRYFEQVDLSRTKPNYRAMGKAAEALGGVLFVQWIEGIE